MSTHYILRLTEQNGRFQRAACGAWVLPAQHSCTPACEPCSDFLTGESSHDAAMADLAATPFDPALAVSSQVHNPIDGYRPSRKV